MTTSSTPTGDPAPRPATQSCPECGATVPRDARFVTWCDTCGWNALVGSERMRHTGPGGLADRWRERMVLSFARRAHAEMLARPTGTGSPWPGRCARVVAALVLTVAAGFVAAVLWWTVRGTGFWHWPGAVAGILVSAALVAGLRRRPDPDVLTLLPEQAPGLHEVVSVLAGRVGAPTPARVHVGTADNAWVHLPLTARRPELTIGLQLWARLDWDERTALLGHELAHLAGRDLPSRRVVLLGRHLLVRTVLVLWPGAYDLSGLREEMRHWGWGTSNQVPRLLEQVAAMVQRVAALPALGTLLLLDVLEGAAGQRREYAADLGAARLAGSRATSSLLTGLLDSRGWRTTVASAVRRGEDPWAALASLGRLPDHELARLRRCTADERVRADASHPPTHLRLDLVERLPASPETVAVPPSLREVVDREVAVAQRLLRRTLEDSLHGV